MPDSIKKKPGSSHNEVDRTRLDKLMYLKTFFLNKSKFIITKQGIICD